MLYNKFRQRTHQSKSWLGSFEEIVKKIWFVTRGCTDPEHTGKEDQATTS